MNTQPNEKGEKTKPRIGYGVKIPSVEFGDAIEIVKLIARNAGESGSLDFLASILRHSRSSSTFHKKVAVLRNFGLISADKVGYAITGIGRRIITPQSPEDEQLAVQEAFSKNEILDRIWGNYKGKILPQREYLANYIEKGLEIPSSLKFQWADYFIDAARVARIIVERESGSFQVLSQALPPPTKIQPTEQPKANNSLLTEVQKPRKTAPQLDETIGEIRWGSLTKLRISDDRMVIVAIPDELTGQDIDKIRIVLKGIDSSLEGLSKSDRDGE